MILRRKLGSLLLLFAAQSLHDVAASDSPLQAVADRLSNPDYAVRFDAALILANTDYPRVEELLVEAQQAEAFTGAEAKAAKVRRICRNSGFTIPRYRYYGLLLAQTSAFSGLAHHSSNCRISLLPLLK